MSDMKCPFCQQELDIGGVDGILRGCPKCRNLGTEMLWQELIRTRKALDVAARFIKGIAQTIINDGDNLYVVLGNFKKFAEDTLNKIKITPEQKE